MASRDGRDGLSTRRLRIPTALAVALVGSSATLAVSFAGCDADDKRDTQSGPIAGDARASDDVLDGDAVADASIDMVDGPPDAPPDAPADAPPDAPVV
jgi:hypothetical protein